MKKWLIVLGLVLVVLLGGLAAAWYWAGPWLAQEYIDWQHEGWDVVHVERYDEMHGVVFIVLIPSNDVGSEEVEAILTTIGRVARILQMPGYKKIAILFVRQVDSLYYMQLEITAPMSKADWSHGDDCGIVPLYFFGATLKPEYLTWPD